MAGIFNPQKPKKEDKMSVKLYSKPACGKCVATKTALDARGITYEYVDVTKDADAFDRVVSLGYREMPVVETSEQHWSGFRLDLIDALAA